MTASHDLTYKTEAGPPSGFRLRPARFEDAELFLKASNARMQSLYGVDEFSLSRVLEEWRTPGFDPECDICLAEDGHGEVIGSVEVYDPGPPHVQQWVLPRVHPSIQKAGVAEALLGWAEQRARQNLEQAPPDVQVDMITQVISRDEAMVSAAIAYGLQPTRHVWRMGIDLTDEIPLPVWPAGITVKDCSPQPDHRVLYRAFRDMFKDHYGWVERPFGEALLRWEHEFGGAHIDPSLYFLAMEGDVIAGLCLCWRTVAGEPNVGYVAELGTRREYRRRGIALALLRHSFCIFQELDYSRVILYVDAASLTGANRLYERAGMAVEREARNYEKTLRTGRDLIRRSLTD